MDFALLRGTVKSQLAWGNFDEFDFINLSLKKLVKIRQRHTNPGLRRALPLGWWSLSPWPILPFKSLFLVPGSLGPDSLTVCFVVGVLEAVETEISLAASQPCLHKAALIKALHSMAGVTATCHYLEKSMPSLSSLGEDSWMLCILDPAGFCSVHLFPD